MVKIRELCVLINEKQIGRLNISRTGRISFEYNEEWYDALHAEPLSLSMPRVARKYTHKIVYAYLKNLLPDNEQTLSRLAREHKISAANPFDLIAVRGEDLPGALQMVPEEKLEILEKRKPTVPLSEKKIAQKIRNIKKYSGPTREEEDSGLFSLSGAQPKMVACLVNGKWREQRGHTPSTHIIKPNMPDLENQVENEHFCLCLANELGLVTARSKVVNFEDQRTIVVERYDRVRIKGSKRLKLTSSGGKVIRVHQEDLCAALAIDPKNKYQRHGGPGIRSVMNLLAGSADPERDRDNFIRACALNFVIRGTDAHGKNYSVLLSGDGTYRLAPLYDIISALPYKGVGYERMAMSINKKVKFKSIYPSDWEAEMRRCNYEPERAIYHVKDIMVRAPDAANLVLKKCSEEGLLSSSLNELKDLISERIENLKNVYN